MNLFDQFKNARLKSVPLVGIETPDPAATIELLAAMPCLKNGKDPSPLLQWDVVRGLIAVNKPGREVLTKFSPDAEDLRMKTQNPTEALILASTLPKKSILFFHNAHRWITNESVAQAAWNLRDSFKSDERMLVLLAPTLSLPAELERDVIILDEALPDDAAREAIILGVHKDAGLMAPEKELLKKAVEASRGLAAFPTEQVVAMSLKKEGLQINEVWERKRKLIESTKGLSMFKTKETFANIGGIQAAKAFARDLFAGNAPPTCIVFLDEIEKAMAGTTGDTSGTSQDQHGQILSTMDKNEWSGMLAVGPPGCTKSMYAKAMAAEFGVPCLSLDLGALKGSLVGQSEQQVRLCLKTIEAVAEGGAFFVATCNKLDVLAPELRRRFRAGVWFFDLPDQDERKAIWSVQRQRYQIPGTQVQPDKDGWTGADIRNCCETAWRLKRTLEQASMLVTPVCESDPESIKKLQSLAAGRFLSASYEGKYSTSKDRAVQGRSIKS